MTSDFLPAPSSLASPVAPDLSSAEERQCVAEDNRVGGSPDLSGLPVGVPRRAVSSVEETSAPNCAPVEPIGEQFLRFCLVPDVAALLPFSQLIEVLTIPVGQIVAIPHTPAWVMGVYNWRGEVLWMVDLAHLVGLTPLYQQAINASTHTAVVLHAPLGGALSTNAGNQMIGLVVNRVEDIEWCDPNLFESPLSAAITTQSMPFLRGYRSQSNGERSAVFDGEAIVAAIYNS